MTMLRYGISDLRLFSRGCPLHRAVSLGEEFGNESLLELALELLEFRRA